MKHTYPVGHLVIDHRASPGLTAQQNEAAGRPPEAAGSNRLEADVAVCRHCQSIIILEPRRTRARGKCAHCLGYLCDRCDAVYRIEGGACRDVRAFIARLHEEASKRLNIQEI